MASRGTGFDAVRKIGLALPGVEESSMHGAPALKVHGQLLACIATNKSAEPNTLVVHVGFEQREELLKRDPQTYYLKPHYENYPGVLVRLSRIDADALRGVLELAWRFATTKKPARKRAVRKRPL
jgi:hypothetical protein